MLTGSLPFIDDDMPRVLARHMCEPVEPLSERAPDAGISRALERAVLRALAKGPDERPANARAFAAELRAALESEAEREGALESPAVPKTAVEFAAPSPEAETDRASESWPSNGRRRVARWVTGAVLAVSSLLALFAVVAPRATSEPDEAHPSRLSAILRPGARAVPKSPVRPVPVSSASRPAGTSDARRVAPRRDPARHDPVRTRVKPSAASPPPPPAAPKPARPMEDDLKIPAWGSARDGD
jgi:serine/threonine-protein kinase